MVQFSSSTPRGETRAFKAVPEAPGNHPGVIVIHEIWGLVDHIKDVSMRFARQGYVALAAGTFSTGKLSRNWKMAASYENSSRKRRFWQT